MIEIEVKMTQEQIIEAITDWIHRKISCDIIIDRTNINTYSDSTVEGHIGVDEPAHENGWRDENGRVESHR